MLRISNHTACRFAEKARFFRSLWAGRRCAAASRFSFFKVETLWSIFSLKCRAFQTIRPVVSRKKRGFSAHFWPGGAVPPPRVSPLKKVKRPGRIEPVSLCASRLLPGMGGGSPARRGAWGERGKSPLHPLHPRTPLCAGTRNLSLLLDCTPSAACRMGHRREPSPACGRGDVRACCGAPSALRASGIAFAPAPSLHQGEGRRARPCRASVEAESRRTEELFFLTFVGESGSRLKACKKAVP